MKRMLATSLGLASLFFTGCPNGSEVDAGVDASPRDDVHRLDDAFGPDATAVEDGDAGLARDADSEDALDAASPLDASLPPDVWSPPDARPTWDPRLGCLGGWSGPLFCPVGQECRSFPNACTPAPSPGTMPTGSICTDRSQCASGICDRAPGFPSRYCFSACERNADCAAGSLCVLPQGPSFEEPNLRRCTPMPADCARCTASTDYCDEEFFSIDGFGDCLAACRTSSDCVTGDCRIRNGSSLTPFCQPSVNDCEGDEIRVDTDSGRRQACVKLRPCFDETECAGGLRCVEVAYGGLSAPVRFCGRVL